LIPFEKICAELSDEWSQWNGRVKFSVLFTRESKAFSTFNTIACVLDEAKQEFHYIICEGAARTSLEGWNESREAAWAASGQTFRN
jgi:hypothetical protein